MGYNYLMTNLQGAVGVVQLKKLDRFIDVGAKWAAWYCEQLKDISWLRRPQLRSGFKHG